jgi:hypothetical protein
LTTTAERRPLCAVDAWSSALSRNHALTSGTHEISVDGVGQRYRATVIVDEAYLEFEPDFVTRTVVGLTRAGENVVVFRTSPRSMAWPAFP